AGDGGPREAGERPPIELLRFVVLTVRIEDRGQRGDVCSDIRMPRSERPLAKRDGSPGERLAGSIPAARMFQPSEVVVNRRGIDMLRAALHLDDGQRLAIDRLGLVVLAGELVQHPYAVPH